MGELREHEQLHGQEWGVALHGHPHHPEHLRDARPDLVQCIKLCEHIMGRGTHLTRPPRLALDATDRAAIEAMMKTALATRPKLPDVGLRAAA